MFGTTEFLKAVTAFSAQYPQVKVKITSGQHNQLFQLLLTDQIDLDFSDQWRALSAEYHNQFLTKSPLMISVAQNRFNNHDKKITTDQLSSLACIMVAADEDEKSYYRDVLGIKSDFVIAKTVDEAKLLIASQQGYLVANERTIREMQPEGTQSFYLFNGHTQLFPNYYAYWKVVSFENNHDGYSNIKQRGRMFNTAFNQLKRQYNFNNFKGIGHSNGGLIYPYFLEHYFNERQIRIKRLMTIGSPYNLAEPDNRRTEMLSDFIKYRNKLPKNLQMYSVAGSENYVEDGLVPLSSFLSGKYVYQGAVKHYTQITVTGRLAQHSALPQNNEVLALIRRYILDSRPANNQPNN